ncbi:uncharacterized protein LOC143653506 [Tamandua tetradactyla]|uniref:uncharacterized protein LOC143653506 n=1 Tax=Tamandua tetradactyla TaxID=48850 RepID=UPI004053E517
MGATVYGVGVKDYEQSQLEGFADSKDHAFGVTGGFNALTSITDRLAERSCIELKSVDPITACVGEEYQVVLRGSGFLNAQDKKLVICRFKFSDNSFSAISVEEKVITCPGVDLKEPGESIAVEVSLNNGISFFSNNLKITGKQCGKDTPVTVRSTKRIHTTRATEAPPEVPPEVPPETTIETETTTETTTHAVTVRVVKTKKFPVVPVLAGVVGLLALLLLLLCLWRLCSWRKEKPPPPPEERVCPPPCPIVIRRCCACFRCGRLMHMEERCLTLTPVRSPCTPMVCRPSLCLPPCREQVLFPKCPPCCYSPWSCSQSSRRLPLAPPCSRALPSCLVQALPPEP